MMQRNRTSESRRNNTPTQGVLSGVKNRKQLSWTNKQMRLTLVMTCTHNKVTRVHISCHERTNAQMKLTLVMTHTTKSTFKLGLEIHKRLRTRLTRVRIDSLWDSGHTSPACLGWKVLTTAASIYVPLSPSSDHCIQ